MDPIIKMAVIQTILDTVELLTKLAESADTETQKSILDMIQRLTTMATAFMSILVEVETQRAALERPLNVLRVDGKSEGGFAKVQLQPLKATGLIIGSNKFCLLMQETNSHANAREIIEGTFNGLTLYRVREKDTLLVIGERNIL